MTRKLNLDFLRKRRPSNEDVLNAVHEEVELTIYAKLENPDLIEKLGSEMIRIEQWEIPTESEAGRMRLRAVNATQYLLTSKVYNKGSHGCKECTTALVKPQFDNIKSLCAVGYYKNRIIIPFASHPHRWEVDLHFATGGAYSNWVKIDLEGFDLSKEIPEELPFDCEEIILSDDPNLSESDRRKIDMIWEDEWVKINR